MNSKYQVAIHHVDGTVEWVVAQNTSTCTRDLAGIFPLFQAHQIAGDINRELLWDGYTRDGVCARVVIAV